MRSSRATLLLAPVLSLALLGACSDDDQDGAEDAVEDVGDAIDETASDAIETAARNIASEQGEEEFGNAGIEVDGDLTCEATVEEQEDAVAISCTGTGTDGQALALTGTTSEVPGASVTELQGEFVGTADDDEVFTVNTLGD